MSAVSDGMYLPCIRQDICYEFEALMGYEGHSSKWKRALEGIQVAQLLICSHVPKIMRVNTRHFT